MEFWQKRAIIKVSKVNFQNDLEEINKTFSMLCDPLTKYDGISYDDGILSIGEKKYSLSIGVNTIGIRHNNSIKGEIHDYFIINQEGEFTYSSSAMNRIPEFKPLESLNFDYCFILNTIMNKIIK